MANCRVLLISVLLLSGCTSDPVSALAGLKRTPGAQADCSQTGHLLNCDWNNVTDKWLDADPAEFSDIPPTGHLATPVNIPAAPPPAPGTPRA